MKKKMRYLALACCIMVFLFSGFMLLRDLVTAAREKNANQKLAEQVKAAREARRREELENASKSENAPTKEPSMPTQEETAVTKTPTKTPKPAKTPTPTPTPLPKYAESGLLYVYDALWQQNNDLAGWLFMDGIDVDYPVMYTADNLEYYLHKGFDGSYAKSGCLFIGTGWSPDSNYTIIYGHHMKNGTMFGKLDSYASEEFAKEHPVIYFDTLTEEGTYEVVAAFYSRVYSQREEGVFRYYQYKDLSAQEDFEEYLRQVRKAAIYDTGIEVEYGDKLLALSTCSYHTDNGRFVVVARQRAEKEEEKGTNGLPLLPIQNSKNN